MPINTIIIPIIRDDNIGKCLETLEKFAGHEYRVIVIDQTGDTKAYEKYHEFAHLWISAYRNLGFSKAMNTGIRLADTEYVTLLNDDVEFINTKWWQGILDTFATDERIVAVNPMSPKEASWGYGYRSDNKDTWQPPKGFVCNEDKEFVYPERDGKGLFYQEFNDEDYDFLLNNHPRWTKDTMCDGMAMWCAVIKKKTFDELGLLEERFFPGGGEDYDFNCRAYSKGYRMVGSTKSWVWHHWSSSRNMVIPEEKKSYFASRPRWNANEQLWGNEFDIWGRDKSGNPLKRLKSLHIESL